MDEEKGAIIIGIVVVIICSMAYFIWHQSQQINVLNNALNTANANIHQGNNEINKANDDVLGMNDQISYLCTAYQDACNNYGCDGIEQFQCSQNTDDFDWINEVSSSTTN